MTTEEGRRARLHREASEAMSPESADAMIDAFPPTGERVATKSDLDTVVRLLEHKIDTEVAELRAEIKGDIADVRVEVAELRAEIKDDLRGLQSTMITTVLASNGATIAILGLAIVLAKIA